MRQKEDFCQSKVLDRERQLNIGLWSRSNSGSTHIFWQKSVMSQMVSVGWKAKI